MENLTTQTFKLKIFNPDKVENDEWKFEGDKPAIIDFYANWCQPCKALSFTLSELEKEYGNKINFYKVDVEEEPELSELFTIKSIPTILFIPIEGNPQIDVGTINKVNLKKIIKDFLKVE